MKTKEQVVAEKGAWDKPKKRIDKIPYDFYKLDHAITEEFKKYEGQPNATRNKRAVIKKYNPFLFIFKINPTQGVQHE
jgi:hypothetical protein